MEGPGGAYCDSVSLWKVQEEPTVTVSHYGRFKLHLSLLDVALSCTFVCDWFYIISYNY